MYVRTVPKLYYNPSGWGLIIRLDKMTYKNGSDDKNRGSILQLYNSGQNWTTFCSTVHHPPYYVCVCVRGPPGVYIWITRRSRAKCVGHVAAVCQAGQP